MHAWAGPQRRPGDQRRPSHWRRYPHFLVASLWKSPWEPTQV